MANPFPLNIPDKEDSFEKEQLMAHVDLRFKYTAEEFNKILAALTWLYINTGGGGGTVYFLGTYTSVGALTVAHPAPLEGSTANIDPALPGTDVRRALWDTNDNKWVLGDIVSGFETEMANALSKAVPADGDLMPRLDSTNANKLVKWTWANVKSALSTFFDARYALKTKHHEFACSDETSDLSVATVYEQRLLRPFPNCTRFDFGVITPPTGSKIIIDVHKNGTTIFTTKPSIDISGASTIGATVQQVIAGGSVAFASGDIIKVIIDQVGSTAPGKNLKAQITYNS